MSLPIHITDLFIYPVKSLAGISLQASALDNMGLQYDRRWMLVSPDGLFLTQRKFPQMALINTQLEAGRLVLTKEGCDPHVVPEVTASNETMQVRIWHDTLHVPLVSKESDAWLSDALGTPCHLVYIPDDVIRQCDPEFAKQGEHTGFADGFPILVISQASLDDLNGRLKNPVEMRRFRPNIVVSGCQPFAEDNWGEFSVGDVAMRGVKRCSRCILTTVDPEKGERSGKEPLETLSTYRQEGNKVYFGINVIHENPGTLKVGDELTLKMD